MLKYVALQSFQLHSLSLFTYTTGQPVWNKEEWKHFKKVKKLKAMQFPESQEKTTGKAGHFSTSKELSSWQAVHMENAIMDLWGLGFSELRKAKDHEVVLAGFLSWVRALPLKWGRYKADLPPRIVTLLIAYHPLHIPATEH